MVKSGVIKYGKLYLLRAVSYRVMVKTNQLLRRGHLQVPICFLRNLFCFQFVTFLDDFEGLKRD